MTVQASLPDSLLALAHAAPTAASCVDSIALLRPTRRTPNPPSPPKPAHRPGFRTPRRNARRICRRRIRTTRTRVRSADVRKNHEATARFNHCSVTMWTIWPIPYFCGSFLETPITDLPSNAAFDTTLAITDTINVPPYLREDVRRTQAPYKRPPG